MIRVEALEEIDRLLEEINHLLLARVVGVAARVEGADAGAVLSPLVLPKRLVVPLVVLPVGVHVVEQVRLAVRRQDVGDVGVGAVRVAVRVVRPVAVVWPCPRFTLAEENSRTERSAMRTIERTISHAPSSDRPAPSAGSRPRTASEAAGPPAR